MKKLIISIILILTAHLVSFVKMWKKGYVTAAAETISPYAVVGQVFPARRRQKSTLESSWILFQSIRFALGARSKNVAFMIACCTHMYSRACEGEGCPLWARLTLFTWITLDPRSLWRGREKRETSNKHGPHAYPVRWPIQGCKICIYDPEWASKITKFYRRFSWFWIILHSAPWPSSTPPSILLRRFKGIERVLSRVAALLWSGPFYSTHGNSLDRSEGTKDSAWFPDGWASEPKRIKDLSAKDGSFDREEAQWNIRPLRRLQRGKIDRYM